jgi:hypothetical protein
MHIAFGVGGGEAGKEQAVSSFSVAAEKSASVVQLYSMLQSRSQETQVGAPSTNAQVLLASVHVVAGGGIAVELYPMGQPCWNPNMER